MLSRLKQKIEDLFDEFRPEVSVKVKDLPVGQWVVLTPYVRVMCNEDSSVDVESSAVGDHARNEITWGSGEIIIS